MKKMILSQFIMKKKFYLYQNKNKNKNKKKMKK